MVLSRVQPNIWPNKLPQPFNFLIFHVLGWISVTCICAGFYIFPIFGYIIIPLMAFYYPFYGIPLLILAFISVMSPVGYWAGYPSLFQLWYKIFNFRANLDDFQEEYRKWQKWKITDPTTTVVLGHFPHGVIPFHGLLYGAFCEQFSPDVYGAGAAADPIFCIPFLKQLLGWVGLTSPKMSNLDKLLETSNLFIFPEGIAGVFCSKPGRHHVNFKSRRGLIRLALKHGSHIAPLYNFGANDTFHQLLTDDSWLSRYSRKMRTGISYFWGQFGLPIPYGSNLTFVFGKTMYLEQDLNPSDEKLDAIHAEFCANLKHVFDKYKADVGEPDAELIFI